MGHESAHDGARCDVTPRGPPEMNEYLADQMSVGTSPLVPKS
jgi:hypothetical protein